jgi:uncharacterized phage protein (TIGR02218 family)
MRTLPTGLQDHLDSGATTLCWCWKLVSANGTGFGFTDHDNDLLVDGFLYQAASGFTGSEIETALGLAIDNLEVAGVLSSLKLNEADLFAGIFDNAEVEIWQVNWADVSQALLLRRGNLGEVTRNEFGFTAEIRGVAHHLNQPRGRLYQYTCDTSLGSPACTVDLADPAWHGSGVVDTPRAADQIFVTGLDGFAANWFDHGKLVFTSGENNAHTAEISSHTITPAGVLLALRPPLPSPMVAGDQFTITAGCDKHFSTCREKFANGINFRGFPHMPGNDFVVFYPNRDDAKNDGAALV